MLLGACGSGAADGGPSSAPAADSPPAVLASAPCTTGARSVCITRGDDGRTVSVGVGWAVVVDLRAPESVWSVPTEVGARLLRQVAVRRESDAVQVAYTARAPGRTELRSLQRPLCHPGRVCPQFIVLWQVRVHVSGR